MAGLVAVLIALLLGNSAVAGPGARPVPPPSLRLDRVALLVLENRSWGQIIGNKKAPYLNALARQGALATGYYAITHPSLPNYIALTTGRHSDINHNCALCRTTARSLANQLDAAGISWHAYFESIRSGLATTVVPRSNYNPHYDPFAYTSSLRKPDPQPDVTGFADLRRALVTQTLPRFAWIAPNTRHDGHNAGLGAADRYARQIVPKILGALGPRGVLFITWDEGQRSDGQGAHGRGGGHLPLIALGPAARAGARVTVRANHYALLRTIEAVFGLPALGHAGDPQTPLLTGLLRPPAVGT